MIILATDQRTPAPDFRRVVDCRSWVSASITHSLLPTRILILVFLILCGVLAVPSNSQAQWSVKSVPQTQTPRYRHTSTLLADGRILVAGGATSGTSSDITGSAEILDPHTGRWTTVAPMGVPRYRHASLRLPDGRIFIAGGFQVSSSELFDSRSQSWSPGPSVGFRYDHTMTLLQDGRVLIAGGLGLELNALNTVGIFDPATDTISSEANMDIAHYGHAAALLPDGRVLIVGGFGGAQQSAETFDPQTGQWTTINNPLHAHFEPSATLMMDGRVLVVDADTEIFDPADDSWTSLGSLPGGIVLGSHTATLLPSGDVVIYGGERADSLNIIHIYKPASGWQSILICCPTSSSGILKDAITTLLPSGRIVTTADKLLPPPGGGATNGVRMVLSPEYKGISTAADLLPSGPPDTYISQMRPLPTGRTLFVHREEAFEFDPATLSWATVPGLVDGCLRGRPSLTILPDGKVLLVGARQSFSFCGPQLYDPFSQSWSPLPLEPNRRHGHRATLLSDGRVLLTGGIRNLVSPTPDLRNADIFDFKTGTWESRGQSEIARLNHTATLLQDGRVLLAGGQPCQGEQVCQGALASAEFYDPETGEFTSTDSMLTGRYDHSAVLLPDGDVLVIGGSTLDFFTSTAERFNVADETWSVEFSLSTSRTQPSSLPLQDGRVLVIGDGDSEIYDPLLHQWVDGPSGFSTMNVPITSVMSDGRILVVDKTPGTTVVLDPRPTSAPRRPVLSDLPVAAYDSQIGAPACTFGGKGCDSGQLLLGRDQMDGGPEPNQPNTIGGSCADGTLGTFQIDEYINRVRLATVDGSPLALGAMVDVQVIVWARSDGSSDTLEVYYANDADNPVWQLVDTIVPAAGGEQVLTTSTFLIDPAGAARQAVRARFRFSGIPGVCGTGAYDDHDDLVFEVNQSAGDPAATPGIPMRYGTTFSVATENLLGLSEGSVGNSRNSSTANPIFELFSLENGKRFNLVPDPVVAFSSGPATIDFSDLPDNLDVGLHLLSATSSGVTSWPVLVSVECGPAILAPPQSVTVTLGQSALFDVVAQGARSFQWQIDPLADGSWKDIPAATASSYTTLPVAATEAGSRYRVVVKGNCSSVATAEVVLLIDDNTDPIIDILSPAGGEYLILSEDDLDPNELLISWGVDDELPICEYQVRVMYLDSNGDRQPLTDQGGLPEGLQGPGVGCRFPGVTTTNAIFQIPASHPVPPGSGGRYVVEVQVRDHAGNESTSYSDPFFIVQPNAESVRTLLLTHSDRWDCFIDGICDGSRPADGAGDVVLSELVQISAHPRVQGFVVDLANRTDLQTLYGDWDTLVQAVQTGGVPDLMSLSATSDAANRVLFGCEVSPECAQPLDGIHDVVLELLAAFPGVRFLVLAGDDRIIPFARLLDRTDAYSETAYTDGPDLSNKESTVGQAIGSDRYLSDDPLAVLDPVVGPLSTLISVPDLAIGRLVETPADIETTVATFISQDGGIDLSTLPDQHRVLVSGYDFLADTAAGIRRTWASTFGVPANPDWSTTTSPVNGVLVDDWPPLAQRANSLQAHLYGYGLDLAPPASPYGVVSLNGHANHHQLGVLTNAVTTIDGLDAFDLFGQDLCGVPGATDAVDLPGRVIYSVGCHGGLTVPDMCPDPGILSLDLPQAMLSRKVQAYIANTGFGWGFQAGPGYSERLVQLFTEELLSGGNNPVGEDVVRAKKRYFQEKGERGFDAYDEKTIQQWTLYGLPMYTVSSTAAVPASTPQFKDVAPAPVNGVVIEELAGATVTRNIAVTNRLPSFLTRLDLVFDFTAAGVYKKLSSTGALLCDDINAPSCLAGCSDPEGCYYQLNGLTSGFAEQPLQPYFVYDSRLSGTSQHGVLWRGGTYKEEAGWQPTIGVLVSNNGPTVPPGAESTPRTKTIRSLAPRLVSGKDPSLCAPSDLELNSVAVTTGESFLDYFTGTSWSQRTFETMDFEVFYFNNTIDSVGNCDRSGPNLLTPIAGFNGEYHRLSGPTLAWAVPADDTDSSVWRVVVNYTDNATSGSGQGTYQSLELADDGNGVWRGEILAPPGLVTYVIQAVDVRGNVSWLEWEWPVVPESGLTPPIPDSVDVSVAEGSADLALAVVDTPDPVVIGDPLVYAITVTNLGPDPATMVSAGTSLSPGASFNLAGGAGWSCDEMAGNVNCTLDVLPVGAAPSLSVFVTPAIAGLLSNMFSVSSATPDSMPGNEQATVDTTVLPGAVHQLSVTKLGDGGGNVASQPAGIDCGSTCSTDFLADSAVTLSATPDPNSLFTGWSGDCTGSGDCELMLDQARSVSANFDIATRTLLVSVSGNASGTVDEMPSGTSCGPGCIEYESGTSVDLLALPQGLASFLRWESDCTGTNPACAVQMTQDRQVDAVFTDCQDDLENPLFDWITTTGPTDSATPPWSVVSDESHSPTMSQFAVDLPQVTDQRLEISPAISILGEGAQLRFWHRFDTDGGFDGGLLEYSVEGSGVWRDILDGDGGLIPGNSERVIQNGYLQALDSCCNNPAPGRESWSGVTGAWQQVIVDLSDFVGSSVHLRWRFVADDQVGVAGWWIDDIELRVASSCPIIINPIIFQNGFEGP